LGQAFTSLDRNHGEPNPGHSCMTKHRFQVGQSVRLSLGIFHPDKSVACEIVQLLPFEDDGFKYRLRCRDESFDRAANEGDLTATIAPHSGKSKARGSEKRGI
jgi:hypothetical protein